MPDTYIHHTFITRLLKTCSCGQSNSFPEFVFQGQTVPLAPLRKLALQTTASPFPWGSSSIYRGAAYCSLITIPSGRMAARSVTFSLMFFICQCKLVPLIEHVTHAEHNVVEIITMLKPTQMMAHFLSLTLWPWIFLIGWRPRWTQRFLGCSPTCFHLNIRVSLIGITIALFSLFSSNN